MLDEIRLAAPRWSVLAPVAVHGVGARDLHAVNISEGGMFVAGRAALAPGQTVEFEAVLPGATGPAVELTGRMQVVWRRSQGADALPAGMGVRFVELAAETRRELVRYLDELALTQDDTSSRWAIAAGMRESAAAVVATCAEAPPPPAAAVEALTPPRLPRRPPPPLPPPRRSACAPAAPPAIEEVELVPRRLGPGDRLGSYELVRLLGSGGTGDVFLANHTLLGRRVAIKTLHPEHVFDREAVRRFFSEARLVNQISHPHIVQITDLASEKQRVYLVMELLLGVTLADLLTRSGALPVRRTVAIGAQLAEALAAIHRAGIVHRDLKPANVMLQNGDFAKVLDFGIAKLRQRTDRQTRAGQLIGTPGFVSPEQLAGKPADHRVDLYALGVTLFVMLTGRMPYKADSWGEMVLQQVEQAPPRPSRLARQAIPRALDTLVHRCLAIEPRERPASAQEVAVALRGFAEARQP